MIKRTVLLVCSVLFAVAVAEIGLRIAWHNPYAATRGDRVLKLRLHHPGLQKKIDRRVVDPDTSVVDFRVDERGYIEPSFRFDEPDSTVAFLGGSTTECSAVQESLRFPALVSKDLEQRGLEVTTLNGARSGSTLHDSLNLLVNHIVQDAPDVVVVMHATNDAGVLRRYSGYGPRMGQYASLRTAAKYVAQTASAHSAVVGVLRKAVTSEGWFISTGSAAQAKRTPDCGDDKRAKMPSADPFRARLRAFVGVCRAFDIQPVLMTQPLAEGIDNELTPDWSDPTTQNVFNQVIRDVSREEETPLIDLAALVAQNASTRAQLCEIFYDGMHVTDFGSQVYAYHIADHLCELLTSPSTQKAHSDARVAASASRTR